MSGATSSAAPEGTNCVPRVLTPSQLALLAAVQDWLIPREDALPGAGEAGAAEVIDRYLAERPAWRPNLLAALQAIDVAAHSAQAAQEVSPPPSRQVADRTGFLGLSGDERDAALRSVEAAQPRLFRWLLRLTYAAYYTDPDVQRARGVTAEPPLPGGHTLPPFDESRLEPIRRRGKLWRDA